MNPVTHEFFCLSDSHGEPPARVSETGITAWLHAGDLCDMGREPVAMIRWASRRRVPVYAVRGNHDAGHGTLFEHGHVRDITGAVVRVAPQLFVAGVGWSGAAFSDLPGESEMAGVCERVLRCAREQMSAGGRCLLLAHYPASLPGVFSGLQGGYNCIRNLIDALHPLAVVQGHVHQLACAQGIYEADGHRTLIAFPGPGGGRLTVDVGASTAAFLPWLADDGTAGDIHCALRPRPHVRYLRRTSPANRPRLSRRKQ